MVALFDMALGLGCSCCNPFARDLPDVVCHKCKKVLYTTREPDAPPDTATTGAPPATGELDMTPRG